MSVANQIRTIIVTCIAVVICVGAARANTEALLLDDNRDGASCSEKKVPTDFAFSDSPIAIDEDSVMFVSAGGSMQKLLVRNQQPNAIDGIVALTEYLDRRGNVIDRVPLKAGTKRFMDTFEPGIRVDWISADWSSPIRSGESRTMGGSKSGTRAGRCPTSAKVTFLQVQFADKTVQTFSAASWQVEAMPKIVPAPRGFTKQLVTPPAALLATVDIDASGSVTRVESDDQTQPILLSWFREWMLTDWKFCPALRDGRPAPSKMTVVLEVGAHKKPISIEPQPSATVIRILPVDSSGGSWDVAFGNLQRDVASHPCAP